MGSFYSFGKKEKRIQPLLAPLSHCSVATIPLKLKHSHSLSKFFTFSFKLTHFTLEKKQVTNTSKTRR
jgi:hypothetical protein